MNPRKFISSIWIDVLSLVVIGTIFVVPFAFIFLTAAKTRPEAALFQFSWPSEFQLLQNIREVLAFGDYRMFRALWSPRRSASIMTSWAALFSALQRECDSPINPLQLHEPVQLAVEFALCRRAGHYHSASDHVHVLPAANCFRDDHWRDQGLKFIALLLTATVLLHNGWELEEYRKTHALSPCKLWCLLGYI